MTKNLTRAGVRGIGLALFMVSTFVLVGQAVAATKESREREALRRVQQMAVKLQQENADLQTQKNEAERQKGEISAKLAMANAELQKLRKEHADAEQRVATLERNTRTAEHENRMQQEKISTTEKTLSELASSKRALEQSAKQNQQRLEYENQHLQALLGTEVERGTSCDRKNKQLATIATELMRSYKQQTPWSTLLAKEPFTGLKSVQIENLLQEYRDRIDDNRVLPDENANPN